MAQVVPEKYSEALVPTHPALRVLHNCEQMLSDRYRCAVGRSGWCDVPCAINGASRLALPATLRSVCTMEQTSTRHGG